MQCKRDRLLLLMQWYYLSASFCWLLVWCVLTKLIKDQISLCMFYVASGTAFITDQESYTYERSTRIKMAESCSLLLIIGCRVNKGWRMRIEGPIPPQQWVLSVQQLAGTALQVAHVFLQSFAVWTLPVCCCREVVIRMFFNTNASRGTRSSRVIIFPLCRAHLLLSSFYPLFFCFDLILPFLWLGDNVGQSLT